MQWLWPTRVALGKLTLIVGEPGLGKSQVTLDCTARITTGNPWPDDVNGFVKAGSVVLLSAEDDIGDTIVPRLKAAGADLQYVNALQGVNFENHDGTKHRCFNLEHDLPHLETAIDATPGCRMVVIDPISSYLGKTDSHKNAELRSLLAPLSDLAAKREIAVVAVSHLNKTSGAKAMHRITGSLAFVAAARAAWLVTPDKDNKRRRLFLQVKNNLAPDPGGLAFSIVDGPALAWEEGVVNISADEALQADEGKKEPARTRERNWLQTLLGNGPVETKEVQTEAKAAGLSWSSVRRAAEDMQVESFRNGFGSGGKWFWRLPIDAQDSPSDTKVSTYEESSF